MYLIWAKFGITVMSSGLILITGSSIASILNRSFRTFLSKTFLEIMIAISLVTGAFLFWAKKEKCISIA